MSTIPVYRKSDNELMGYVVQDGDTWKCLTIFGYVFSIKATKQEAAAEVQLRGLEVLTGVWEYYDKSTGQWLNCTIIEASKDRIRIAPFDGMYPDPTKSSVITGDLATILRKE